MSSYAKQAAALLKPTVFSDGVATVTLDALSRLSLTVVVGSPGYPNDWVLRRWCQERPDFAASVVMARQIRAAHMVEKMITISDDASGDYQTVTRRDGSEEEVFNHEHASRSKLRVDTLKWVAGRLDREAWGETKHIKLDAKVLTVSLTDDELDRQLEQAMGKLKVINEAGLPQVLDNIVL